MGVTVDVAMFPAANDYRNATPFPHTVIDGAIDAATLRAVVDEFGPDGWSEFNAPGTEWRKAQSTMLGPAGRQVIAALMAPQFVARLETLTGIAGLVPDLLGGGMHRTREGGHLAVHVDFNWHHTLKLRRRVNLLLFLNEGWSTDDGGLLELWGEHGCATQILPTFNRLVIFNTSDRSWHGHPTPVAAGKVRRSLAVYYYAGRDLGVEHSTVWRDQ